MHKLVVIAFAALLASCGRGETQAPEATVQSGIDRSVADVRAAEAATAGPVVQSKSVSELTAKPNVPEETAGKGKSEAKAKG